MLELISNCAHGSEISTYFENEGDARKNIIKTAATVAGISDLEKEIEGWKFYQRIRYPLRKEPICKIVRRCNSYLKISIELIKGFNPSYKDIGRGLTNNANLVSNIVEHYCVIWPYYKDKKAAIHGDLSIINIIYNNGGIHIIDWEHYEANGGPWGFDVIYCLYETLWFGMRGRNEPTREEVLILARNLNVINSYRQVPIEIILEPLRFLCNFIRNNSELWGEQLLNFPDKLPILNFTPSQITSIDDLVSQEIEKV